MTGVQKAAIIIVLMTVALIGFNAFLWRRMREAVEEGRRREIADDRNTSDTTVINRDPAEEV